jgi:electron transfer flavoprotein alpha subunit
MSILVFAEQRGGALRQAASETVTAGRVLADTMGVELTAVLVGPPSITGESEKLGRHGADKVLLGSDEVYGEYLPGVYADAVVAAVTTIDPKVILFPASALGKDLAPRVAARLKAGLVQRRTGGAERQTASLHGGGGSSGCGGTGACHSELVPSIVESPHG